MRGKPKKRRYGMGCVFQINESWYVKVIIDGKPFQTVIKDPVTGRKPESEKEAHLYGDAIVLSWRSGGKTGIFEPDKKKIPTLFELNQGYMQAFSGRWDRKRKVDWLRYIEEAMQSFNLVSDISQESLGEHIQKRLNTPKIRGGGKRTRTNVNRSLTALNRLLNWSVETGKIDKNPMTGFPKLKEPLSRDRVLSKEERERLKTVLKKTQYQKIRLIIFIALISGMRKSEILNLRWEDIDIRSKEFDLLKTKSGKRRRIPIPEELMNEITNLPKHSDYIFPSSVDSTKPLTNIRKSFCRMMEEAKIFGCTLHDLRHTVATDWKDAGVDIKTIMELLGHASITTTQRYLSSLAESKRKAVEDLASQIIDSQ